MAAAWARAERSKMKGRTMTVHRERSAQERRLDADARTGSCRVQGCRVHPCATTRCRRNEYCLFVTVIDVDRWLSAGRASH
jgi:hypothetical protein